MKPGHKKNTRFPLKTLIYFPQNKKKCSKKSNQNQKNEVLDEKTKVVVRMVYLGLTPTPSLPKFKINWTFV